jgi:CRISPR-associated protein Cas5d
LENVCYKIYGEIETRETLHVGQNPGHMLQEVFLRRLRLGQFYSTPFLGWKEFIPTYFGPLRDHTHADTSIEQSLPTMLVEMYTSPTRGRIAPQFKENVMIRQGVLCYD